MFIRRKLNRSETFSVQVLDKRNGRNVLLHSFGASTDETELHNKEKATSDYIARYGGQDLLDFNEGFTMRRDDEADMFLNRIVDIKQDAPRVIILRLIYDGVGLGSIDNGVLSSLAIARVCQPKSKITTVEYLKCCFRKDYKLHHIYRYMDTLYNTQRELIHQISVEHTRNLPGGRIGIVFYDATPPIL